MKHFLSVSVPGSIGSVPDLLVLIYLSRLVGEYGVFEPFLEKRIIPCEYFQKIWERANNPGEKLKNIESMMRNSFIQFLSSRCL